MKETPEEGKKEISRGPLKSGEFSLLQRRTRNSQKCFPASPNFLNRGQTLAAFKHRTCNSFLFMGQCGLICQPQIGFPVVFLDSRIKQRSFGIFSPESTSQKDILPECGLFPSLPSLPPALLLTPSCHPEHEWWFTSPSFPPPTIQMCCIIGNN